MRVISEIIQLRELLVSLKSNKVKVGFVPTMGFLHDGHLKLVRKAKADCDIVVVSIYVNPSQFNDAADFEHYPKDLDRDKTMLQSQGCDILWLPSQSAIEALDLPKVYDVEGIDEVLEGRYRPGHFKGVKEVVFRLFSVVMPHRAYFGEKDFQQFAVIKALVRRNELPIDVVGVPTEREADGLAMSSRNVRLSGQERILAPQLYRNLKEIVNQGEAQLALSIDHAKRQLEKTGFKVEYLEVHELFGLKRLFIAAHLGKVRLIDNVSFSV